MTETSSSHPAAQWAYRSAGELAQSLLKKEISALELTDQFIARIEALDGDLNAVPVRDFARAREAARQADAALARGERRPLLGVPVTIKESYNMAGLPTTWGIPAARDFVPEEDALAVARLKGAGVVILGKTNVPLVLGDWQSYNDIHGATNNPWDKTRTPGAHRGVHPRRSPLVSVLCRSARISAGPCAFRRISAESARTSQRTGLSLPAVMSRQVCPLCR
jgi:amidase